MKASMFHSSGLGVVSGRLIAPDKLLFEREGQLETYTLIGKVRETEYNDVFVVGERNLETKELLVHFMESVPKKKEDTPILFTKDFLTVIAVYQDAVTSIKKESNVNGTFLDFRITLEKNTYANIKVALQNAQKDKENYLFVLTKVPEWKETVFQNERNSFCKKTIRTMYSYGYQLLT